MPRAYRPRLSTLQLLNEVVHVPGVTRAMLTPGHSIRTQMRVWAQGGHLDITLVEAKTLVAVGIPEFLHIINKEA
jgi:hypothetical protein